MPPSLPLWDLCGMFRLRGRDFNRLAAGSVRRYPARPIRSFSNRVRSHKSARPMRYLRGLRAQARAGGGRCGQASRFRTPRCFLPQVMFQLEERTAMSAGSWWLQAPREWLSVAGRRAHDRDALSHWHATRNVPFPTVDGRTELLDVYQPAGPAPPSGHPVLIAIHGGGWRRFDKSEYGERIARAF